MLSGVLSRCCQSLFQRPRILGRGGTRNCFFKPRQKEAFYDVEGVVKKDTLLFRYEDPKTVGRKGLIGVVMMPVGVWLGYFSYSLHSTVEPMREGASKNDRINYLLNNVSFASRGVGLGFFLFCGGLSSYWVVRTKHTVRKLVLRKGGKLVSIQTYGILGRQDNWKTIPLTYCTGQQHKFYGKHRFFLKIRDHSFKYHFNLEDGVFSNRALFDRTLGMGRQ